MKVTLHLTPLFTPETERAIRKTYPGQASWAGEGPFATTCGDCKHHGCYRQIMDRHSGEIKRTAKIQQACAEYRRLTGKVGPAVPKHAEACRFFERKGD